MNPQKERTLTLRMVGYGLSALLGLGLMIQLVPYGREHRNPEARREPNWDQPRTRELFFQVCKDCHSNETEWPTYSFVAPMSWLVQSDVEEGRSHFNVSEWGRDENHGDEAAKMVRAGDMPPWIYLPTHPEALLSDSERKEFVAGLIATFGEEDDHDHGHDADHDE
jgi:mono/diheme cytochrome c family protein